MFQPFPTFFQYEYHNIVKFIIKLDKKFMHINHIKIRSWKMLNNENLQKFYTRQYTILIEKVQIVERKNNYIFS